MHIVNNKLVLTEDEFAEVLDQVVNFAGFVINEGGGIKNADWMSIFNVEISKQKWYTFSEHIPHDKIEIRLAKSRC